MNPSTGFLRKLARWVPNAHFSIDTSNRIGISTPEWSEIASAGHIAPRGQSVALLKSLHVHSSNPETQEQVERALTLLGEKSARRHFEVEILDF